MGKNIYGYYKNLFIREEGQSQIIFATHSERVLESAIEDNTSLILKLNNRDVVYYEKGSSTKILPVVTSAEIKYSIFNIYSIDFHILLFGYIQNLIGEYHIDRVDKWFLTKENVPLKNYFKEKDDVDAPSYKSLCCYVRNCIDHPENTRNSYTDEELKTSTEFMINIIKNFVKP